MDNAEYYTNTGALPRVAGRCGYFLAWSGLLFISVIDQSIHPLTHLLIHPPVHLSVHMFLPVYVPSTTTTTIIIIIIIAFLNASEHCDT